MKIAERTATWRRERRVLLRVSRQRAHEALTHVPPCHRFPDPPETVAGAAVLALAGADVVARAQAYLGGELVVAGDHRLDAAASA